MKFKKLFSLLLLAIFTVTPLSFADVVVQEDGVQEGIVSKINFTTNQDVSVSGRVATVQAEAAATFEGATITASNVGSVLTQATTATLTAAQLKQNTILNTGAAGAIVYTLPAPTVGMEFTVYLTDAQDVDINPADGTQILQLTNATGDAISSAATAGNRIVLRAISTTQWIALETSGTWTDVN